MFEFNGNLSREIVAKIKKSSRKAEILSISIVTIPCCILLGAFALDGYPIVLLLLVVFALMYVPSFLPPTKSFFEYMPNNILIDSEEGTIVYKNKTTEIFHMISDIEAIDDHEDFYRIKFSVGDKNPYYILQKDLIVQGTIEEFEKHFESKIRKVK